MTTPHSHTATEGTANTEGRIMAKRRIVNNDYGFSVRFDDPDPMTRYAPPAMTMWEKVCEAWRLGWVRYKGGSA